MGRGEETGGSGVESLQWSVCRKKKEIFNRRLPQITADLVRRRLPAHKLSSLRDSNMLSSSITSEIGIIALALNYV